jgi:hypothetical protein
MGECRCACHGPRPKTQWQIDYERDEKQCEERVAHAPLRDRLDCLERKWEDLRAFLVSKFGKEAEDALPHHTYGPIYIDLSDEEKEWLIEEGCGDQLEETGVDPQPS